MRPVIQEEPTGCGIAAVAALARVTYAQARARARRLGIVATDSDLWSDSRYVRRLLASYGIRAAGCERPFRKWPALPPLALLAIKWHRLKGRACWHWVVYRKSPDGPGVGFLSCVAAPCSHRFRPHASEVVHWHPGNRTRGLRYTRKTMTLSKNPDL
jgi:hypothetical protein